MSKLSDRLSEAKAALDLTASKMVRKAEQLGVELSDYSAKVYISGNHPEKPTVQTLRALSAVLEVPLDEVLELAGINESPEEFKPHESADLLTAPQRTAVNEIIRLLADGNRKSAKDEQQDEQPDKPRLSIVGASPGEDVGEEQKIPDGIAAYDRELGDGFQPGTIPED